MIAGGSGYLPAMSELDLVIVAAVSLAGSFVKAVTGMGYPLIAVPALTLFLGIEAAIVVIAIPNTVLNAWLVFDAWPERAHTRDLPVLVATSLVGGVIGTLVLIRAPERPLVIFLAATVLFYVVQKSRQPDLSLDVATTKRFAPAVGTIAGFCHGAVGISGPVVAVWFHGYRLPKNAYVLSIASLFLMGGLAQLGVLLQTGAFDADRWVATGVGLAGSLAAIPPGKRLRNRISPATFETLILWILVGSGVSLLVRAFG